MRSLRSHTHYFPTLVVLASLTAAALACDINLGGPTPPASPIPVSTEAAGQLEGIWKSAVENSKNGEVSATITEEQLTSFVAFKLAEQEDPLLRGVQVYLRDGQIQLFGTATVRSVSAPALITLVAAVTPDGRVQVTMAEADLGPVPVPASVLENLSQAINEGISGQLGSQVTGLRISSVTIADGQMALTGTVQP